ncbi:RNA recognition motif containing protein [Nitzschia inconspicua]|uniref:RNA recognition motif containing protein n=1 Tax=Nitzschia inconspicua TaxID=303405 RepID=A0A9K3PPU6_9STRA|nr:RNA recognition motif containing protein [Nitzschia inconspicua]
MDNRNNRGSSFHRARDRFERKRKNYGNDGGGGGSRGRGEYDDERNGSSGERGNSGGPNGRRQRRSGSPPRWERGKKQQKKTQTDVPPERELFVGNIPSNIDEQFLLNFLNGAMRHANLCPRHENPCLSCQINSGNFAFVEMLNAELANKCLNLNGILFLNARVKVGRPKKYSGPFVVAKTWQELTGDTLTIDAVLDSEKEKVNRELFVGNTTPEMTDQMLKDFLGSAMEQVGLTIMDGNPITLCEMFGKYAFIELRTPREAANALNLNNILFMGSNLQITRPSKYQGKFEEHMNWEQILARYGLKPEEFQLGQVLNKHALLASATAANAEPMDENNIAALKAELVQVKKALEITRVQLDESNKKSEARKEQLVSLNKKWAEGKNELNEHKQELFQAKEELKRKVVTNLTVDIDSRTEAQELRKKHEETQGMLRGVTESLLSATEKLQNERKARMELEQKFKEAAEKGGFSVNLTSDSATSNGGTTAAPLIDFASLRAEMNSNNMSMEEDAENKGGMEIDTAMDDADGGGANMESLKEFLAKTPKAEINWNAAATPGSTATATPGSTRSRDRGGVRLCRMLIKTAEMSETEASEVQGMASKYNLGGFIRSGKPGLIVVEGLEFNADIFMDNMERQKKNYENVGKVSERSGRAFPMHLTMLSGDNVDTDFAKACESVGLKEPLQAIMSG